MFPCSFLVPSFLNLITRTGVNNFSFSSILPIRCFSSCPSQSLSSSFLCQPLYTTLPWSVPSKLSCLQLDWRTTMEHALVMFLGTWVVLSLHAVVMPGTRIVGIGKIDIGHAKGCWVPLLQVRAVTEKSWHGTLNISSESHGAIDCNGNYLKKVVELKFMMWIKTNYECQVRKPSIGVADAVHSMCKLINSNMKNFVLIFGCRVLSGGISVHLNWWKWTSALKRCVSYRIIHPTFIKYQKDKYLALLLTAVGQCNLLYSNSYRAHHHGRTENGLSSTRRHRFGVNCGWIITERVRWSIIPTDDECEFPIDGC